MKILLIDDHDLFREGLKLLLLKLDPDCILLDARNLHDGVELARQADIDLVLFDLGLPGYSGTEALALFREQNCNLPVVVLSGLISREMVIAALECGAMGFIPKTASTETLGSALQMVLANGVYIPPSVFSSLPPGPAPTCIPAVPLANASQLNLTERQLQVFKLIVQGKSNKAIARDLGLTESTIKAHVKPILKSLNVTSRIEAILEVSRRNILLN